MAHIEGESYNGGVRIVLLEHLHHCQRGGVRLRRRVHLDAFTQLTQKPRLLCGDLPQGL